MRIIYIQRFFINLPSDNYIFIYFKRKKGIDISRWIYYATVIKRVQKDRFAKKSILLFLIKLKILIKIKI